MIPAADEPVLKREMTSVGGLLITLAGLSPGIGVFIVGSDVLHQVGSGVILCFTAAIVLGIAMASVYAELGSAFPHTGGEYTIAGRVLGVPAGFAMLAINLGGLCFALPLSGLGMADYLRVIVPGLPVVPTALAAVAVVTLIAVLSVRLNAVFTGTLLAAEIAALAVTALLGLLHAHGDLARNLLHPMMADGTGGVRAVPAAALGVAAASGIYAFNGYGSVVLFGEELRDARRSVAAVVYWSLAIAAVAEMLPLLGIVVGSPDLARLAASATPVPDFIRASGGPTIARLISLCVAAAIFNAMIAVALAGGRQLYASARDGSWPAAINRRLARVHPTFHSPHVATLTVGAGALACCFVPLNVLVVILANGNVATYATLCVAVMIGRRNNSTAQTHARMKLFPLPPLLALLALAGVLWADMLDPAAGLPGLLVTVAMLCAGVGYYLLVVRRRNIWRHYAPAEEPRR
ncbi:APC family permease [Lichenicoccus sp.]|uniref:APC family permease n=1 Tax=Lichenicoccus sp. TaxID=2781899 RepID=UPI003D149785